MRTASTWLTTAGRAPLAPPKTVRTAMSRLSAHGVRVGEVAQWWSRRPPDRSLREPMAAGWTEVGVRRAGNRTHDDGLRPVSSCELKDGFPLVGSAGPTSMPGVWAAGNVADPRAQVDA